MKDEFKRRDNETDEEYEVRICSYHDSMKLSWDEVTSIINTVLDYNYTESRYRKMWKAYCLGVDNASIQKRMRVKNQGEYLREDLKDNVTEEDDVVEDYEDIEDEDITADRAKYAATIDKMAYARTIRQDSRFERFYRYVASAITKYGPIEVPKYQGKPLNVGDMEYVVPIADLHLGAKFHSFNNDYSIEEAKRRMGLAAQRIIEFVQAKNLSKITIVSLGDLIEGILRLQDLRLNEEDVSNAFVIAIRLLAGFLNRISEYCYIDYIHICYSNHEQMRPLGTKASELAAEDMGKISFAYLQDVLASNARINVMGDPDRNYYMFNIFNFKFYAAHGHTLKSPQEAPEKLTRLHRQLFDYIILGHSHSTKEFVSAEGSSYDIEVLVAPSIVGSDPYADSLFVGSKSAIKIFGFDRHYGHTETYKYILN